MFYNLSEGDDNMKELQCIIIDEITYDILKDEYQECKFGLTDVGVEDAKTKVYHMLYKNNLITEDNRRDISLLPIEEILNEGVENEPDKVYSIIFEIGDLSESPQFKR